ncbi:MAG: DUF502 domain-containing protein [Clostridiales bacterium]|jgi:uncharacterized membrane protein|nr:DUF502 domain-containing protein [Clostridiales bacterium]
MKKNMKKNIKRSLLTGFIVFIPMLITLWIFLKVFNTLDSILGKMITELIGFKIPGLGFILFILLILGVGLLTNNVFGKRIMIRIEKTFENAPIIKSIYIPIRDILRNLSNKKSTNFKKAVFVEFPKEKSFSIGFITKENIMVNGEMRTAIFVPTTPNPTSGFLVYLKREEYMELDIPVDIALKSIISLGSVSPDIIEIKKED